MELNDYLLKRAIKEIWCSPRQDTQFIFKPQRVSNPYGVKKYFNYQNVRLTLPSPEDAYSIYAVGALLNQSLNMFPTNNWSCLADLCVKNKIYFSVYDNKGSMVSLNQVFVGVTHGNGILFAVKHNTRHTVDLINNPLFFRIYSNNYFFTDTGSANNEHLEVFSKQITVPADRITILDKQDIYRALEGFTLITKNGVVYNKLTLADMAVGDMVEMIYDSSVTKVKDFLVHDLLTFQSKIDGSQKYLLHYPEKQTHIDYCDDVDLYVMNGNIGAYLHKNAPDTIRQVTHQDYSVTAQYLVNIARDQGYNEHDGLILRAVIRQGSVDRSLVNEHHRIHELYKLSDEQIIRAMVGINSVVPEWTAASLESSYYTKVMGSLYKDLTLTDAQRAYGYNAAAVILGDTPKAVTYESGVPTTLTPATTYINSCGFEYDANGLLLEAHNHVEGYYYNCNNPLTKIVEQFSGTIDEAPDDHFDTPDGFVLDDTYDYRFYISGRNNQVSDGLWEDATGSDKYTISDNKVYWSVDTTNFMTLIRSNKKVLFRSITQNISSGVFEFTLTYRKDLSDGTSVYAPMEVPMGELTVWLNKKTLIQGIDYLVNFPKVIIISKRHLGDMDSSVIDYRFMRHCTSELTLDERRDYGFIRYGLASLNSKYNLRDDMVVRCIVGGHLTLKSSIKFDEDGWALFPQAENNGLPYSVEQVFIPFLNFATENAYDMRKLSEEVDHRVSEYLYIETPARETEDPNVLPRLYELYSPFCSRILARIVSGEITPGQIYDITQPMQMMEFCKPYEYLLKFDPTQSFVERDTDNTIIHPTIRNTVVRINADAYRFMNLLIKTYLGKHVKLSHFVEVV